MRNDSSTLLLPTPSAPADAAAAATPAAATTWAGVGVLMDALLAVSLSANLRRFLAAVAAAVAFDNDSLVVSFRCADWTAGCAIAELAADAVDNDWPAAAPATALTDGGKGLGYILLPSFGVAGWAPTTTGTAFGVLVVAPEVMPDLL